MRIIYDDMVEFAEVVIRCEDMVRACKCTYCPFFERCDLSELGSRHVLCGEIKGVEEKGGVQE